MSYPNRRKQLYAAAFAAVLATIGFGVGDAQAGTTIELDGISKAMVDIRYNGSTDIKYYQNTGATGVTGPAVPIVDAVTVTGAMTPTLSSGMGPGAIVSVYGGIPAGSSLTVSPTNGELEYDWSGDYTGTMALFLGGIISQYPGAGDLAFTGSSLTTTVNVANKTMQRIELSGISNYSTGTTDAGSGTVSILNSTVTGTTHASGDTIGVYGHRSVSGTITGTATAANVILRNISRTATGTSGSGATAAIYSYGTHGVYGGKSAIATGTVTLDTITRTATSQNGGNATANDNLSGVSAIGSDAAATAGGAVTISDVSLKATVESNSGTASANGDTIGLRGYYITDGTGTASATSVTLRKIERTAEVASGATGGAYASDLAFTNILGTHGVYGGTKATATGAVTLDTITRRAISQEGNAYADDNLSGVSAVGTNAAATAGGAVTISNVALKATAATGTLTSAYASGDTIGVRGYNDTDKTGTATATSVTIQDIERIAEVKGTVGGAEAQSDLGTHGVYGGTKAVATGAVTLDKITRMAISQSSLGISFSPRAYDNLSGVSAVGSDAIATAGGAVTISDVSLKAATAGSDGGNAYAYGDTIGVRGYNAVDGTGTATATSVTLRRIERIAEVEDTAGDAYASDPYGTVLGTHGVYGGTKAVATGAVTLDKITRTATSQSSNPGDPRPAYAHDSLSGVSAVGANAAATAGGAVTISDVLLKATVATGEGSAYAQGDTIGVRGYNFTDGTGTATATSVTLRDIERIAEVKDTSGTANAQRGDLGTHGVYGGAKAVATGAVTLERITRTATSKGSTAAHTTAFAVDNLSGVSAVGVGAVATAGGVVTISDVSLRATVDSDLGNADAGGDTIGVRGHNLDASSGAIIGTATATSVTIQDIERIAEVKGSDGNASAQQGNCGTHGVYGGAKAVATGTVTLDNITRSATSRGVSITTASAVDNLSGVSAVGANAVAIAGGTVTISDVSLKATVETGSGVADDYGDTIGVYGYNDASGTITGTATATSVTIRNIERIAKIDASASGTASAYGFTAGVYGGAAATATGAVTLENIKQTATSRSGNADATGDLYGVSAKGDKAAATAGGAVSISNVAVKAEVASGAGNARVYGRSFGVSATGENGTATALADVTLTGIARSAAATDGNALASGWIPEQTSSTDYEVTMYDTAAGVYSASGDAFAGGAVAVSESRAAAAGGVGANQLANGDPLANIADARLKAYGVYAGRDATVRGGLSVTSDSSAAATNNAIAYEYGLAAGAAAGRSITIGGAGGNPLSIAASGTTYAVGLMLQPADWDAANAENAARTITVAAPLTFSLDSKATANDYISYERTQGIVSGFDESFNPIYVDLTAAQREALPVLEAEYLGLGRNDAVNFNLDADATNDNNGNAQRFFGIETISVSGGTASFGDGSYFINQRDFDASAGEKFGSVDGSAALRSTTLAARNGGTLRIDGTILSEITTADGAHETRFSTSDDPGDPAAEYGFRLDRDYALALRADDGGAVTIGSAGAMAMTSLNASAAGRLTYEVAAGDGDALLAGSLNVRGLAKFDSRIYVRPVDLFDMETDRSYSLDGPLLTYGTLDWRGDQLFEGLFHEYSLTSRDGAIWLDFHRNSYATFEQALNPYQPNDNVMDLARGLDGYDYANTFLAPFMDKLIMETQAVDASEALRQLTGENASTAVNAALEAHRNLLGLNGGYFFGSFDNMNAGGVSINELNGADAYGSLRSFDAASVWKVRAVASWNRLNLSGSDGFSPYRSTNRTVLLAGERSGGGVSVGLAAGLGWTRTKATDFDSRSKSEDYGVIGYGRYDFDQMFVAGRVGFSYSDVESDRRIPFMGERARGDFSAKFLSAGLYGGHDFDLCKGWGLTLVGGAAWQRTIARGFSERGSDFALAQSGWNADSFELQADARLTKKFVIDESRGSFVMPRVSVGVAYELGDRGAGGTTTFVNAPDFPVFRAETSRVGRFKGVVGAGVDYQITRNLGVSAEYAGSFRHRAVEHGGRVSVSWTW